MSTPRIRDRWLRFFGAVLFGWLFAAFVSASSSFGDEKIWKGPARIFTLPTVWDPEGVPSRGDDVSIADVVDFTFPEGIWVAALRLGKGQIRGDGDITADLLTLADSNFTIPSNLALGRARQVTIAANGLLSGTNSVTRLFVNQGLVTNFGTVAAGWTAPNQIAVKESPGWRNEAESQIGLPEFVDNVAFRHPKIDPAAPYPLPEQFPWLTNEANAFIIKTNPGQSHIEWSIRNRGVVRVDQGQLYLQSAGSLGGTIHVAEGAKLHLWTSIYRYTDPVIEEDLAFSGFGTVLFRDAGHKPFQVKSTLRIPNPVEIDTAAFDGFGINFEAPVAWTNLTGAGSEPVVFLTSSFGQGELTRNVLNFGSATDNFIRPANGVWWANMPLSRLTVTDALNSESVGNGTLTNHPLATIDLGNARDRKWNIVNEGMILGPFVKGNGQKLTLKGNLNQSESGEIQLRGGTLFITNEFSSDGLITGEGVITAAVVRVSGTVAPGGFDGYYGKISLTSQKYPNLTISPSTRFQMDLGAGTNDQLHVEAGSFKGVFEIHARDGFGPGDYLLATYFGTAGPFQFSEVPPGYRYLFVNDTTRHEIHLVVTEPERPVALLKPSPDLDHSLTLEVSTLPDVPYQIEFAEELGAGWRILTNLMGDGQIQSIRPPLSANGFFRVTEGSP